MYVRDIMTTNVVTIPSSTSIADTKRIMEAHRIRRLPVVDKGKLVGIVTDRRLESVSPSKATSLTVWELSYLLDKTTVKEIMERDVITVSPDMNVEESVALAQGNRVGALVVVGLLRENLDTSSLIKVVVCWVATPFGAALVTIVLYFLVGKLVLNILYPSVFLYDRGLRWLLVVSGSYGAYALGANNVANVTAPFVGPDMLSPTAACLVGSLAIALGVLTYSRSVMLTVGKDLVRLDAFTAFIAILAEAVTVHIFAEIGVPVSTSQAVVGAVLGVGILRGAKTIELRTPVPRRSCHKASCKPRSAHRDPV